MHHCLSKSSPQNMWNLPAPRTGFDFELTLVGLPLRRPAICQMGGRAVFPPKKYPIIKEGPKEINDLIIWPSTPNITHLRWNRSKQRVSWTELYAFWSDGDPRQRKNVGFFCFFDQVRVPPSGSWYLNPRNFRNNPGITRDLESQALLKAAGQPKYAIGLHCSAKYYPVFGELQLKMVSHYLEMVINIIFC